MKTTKTRKFTKIIAAVLAAAAITVSAGAHSVSASIVDMDPESRFLKSMGFSANVWTEAYSTFHWKEASRDLEAAWARAGVTVVTKVSGNNEYYINGKRVRRYQAYEHVRSLVNKHNKEKKD